MADLAESQALSLLQGAAKDGKISKDMLGSVLRQIDPAGGWTEDVVSQLASALTTEENGGIRVEHVMSKMFLQTKVAELQRQIDAITKLSKQGGIGFPEGIEANKDKNSLEGLLIKVNHVSRICSSAEKSREFYMDLLGATILNRPNFPSPGYWLWLGNVQLHLIQGANAKEEATHAAGVATGNVNHISFEVWDFDAVEAKLKKIGYPYKKNRVPEGGNVIHQLFLEDPDGHFIEICDCNRFSDFVFGPPPDPAAAKDLAAGYNEGVDPTGKTIAAVAALAFLPGECKSGSEQEFHESLGMLQRAFKIFAKGDDKIESKDLGQVMKRMGHKMSEDELAKMIAEADKDNSGHIGFKEFVKFMAPKLKADNSNEDLKEAFDAIDTDGSGHINTDELLLMLWGIGQRVNEEQLCNAIKAADKDKSGQVSFPEFLELFKGLSKGVGA